MSEHIPNAAWPLSAPPVADERCAQQTEAERSALINGLKTQIRDGIYRPDVRELAKSLASMLVRNL